MNSVALYIRLSKEDIEKDKNNNSESIDNQISMLNKYCYDNNYNIYDTYIDDGYTGTNFDRPGFKKLKKDIEDKLINIVIVKDLSRLGRDYITTGYFLEIWFPKHNVRFISLLDNIDTLNNNTDIAPFKSIINDMYSKDNSKKIKASLRIKQQMGKWVGGCTPYGYKQDLNDKNHLVIDNEEAKVIKKIYSLFLSGYSINKIANYLFENNILTPTLTRNIKRSTKYSKYGYWSSTTIKTILSNELYTGDLVQNRRNKINYKVKKLKNNKREDWIIIKKTHDAIIEKDKFDEVQRLLSLNRSIRKNNNHERLLTGLIYCADCKKRMSIQNNYIICNTYKKYSKLKLCTSHSCNYLKIEKYVIDLIKKLISLYKNKIDNYLLKIEKNVSNESKIKILNDRIERLYIDKLDNKISDNIYVKLYNNFMDDINNLKNEHKKSNIGKTIENFTSNISRRVILSLIDRIEIRNKEEIDIYFNFKKEKNITIN